MRFPPRSRPVVVLFHDPSAPLELIVEFKLGCEEEGVPVSVREVTGISEDLARLAAGASPIFVGAGIDDMGAIALHESRLGDRPPLFQIANVWPAEARAIGKTAGRIIRGRPIEVIVAGNNV